MSFHSEIKVSYEILNEIVSELKKYESALIRMEKSIANMDKVISENEGRTFDALRKVKHDFDGEIDRCKGEIKDIYTSIESYASDMKGIIGASPSGSMLLVDRLDIWLNMQSIKNASYAIGEVGKYQRGMTVYTPAEGDDPARLYEIRRNTQRNREMQEAIGASSERIKRHYESINRIYKNKIVKFENKDDEHESKLEIVHLKYTNILESFREDGKAILDLGKAVFNWGKDLIAGIGGLFKTIGAVGTYAVCKLVQVEPPKWSKEAVDSLKGISPWTMIESMCQSGSDSVADKGWAYGIGYVAPDVVIAILGTKGLNKAGKIASKIDDIGDYGKLSKLDKYGDIADAGKAIRIKKLKLRSEWEKYANAGIEEADIAKIFDMSEKAPKVKYIKGNKPDKILLKPKWERPSVEKYLNPKYIEEHRKLFDEGAVKFQKYKPNGIRNGGIIGGKDGNSFWISKKDADIIQEIAGNNNRAYEAILGFDEGYLGDAPLYRIDVPPEVIERKGIFIPRGTEDGVNEWWRPGGRTYPGNIPEGVMKGIGHEKGDYIWSVANYHGKK